MKKYLAMIIVLFGAVACTNTKQTDEIELSDRVFKLESGEKEVIVDSALVKLNNSIHGKGRVQFPIYKAIEHENYSMLINFVFPGNSLDIAKKQTSSSNEVLARDNESFFIKKDSLFILRTFIEVGENKQVYEVNLISNDSIKMKGKLQDQNGSILRRIK